ncbi:hypothetical protein IAE22_31660, partial [Bacillus sp. S34]|nr:hypothetical protein [Bacillus sp. S34]
SMTDQLHVAVIGLEFGAEFVPIYKDHPHVRAVTACDLDAGLTAKTAKQFQVSTADSLDVVLRDPDVDAVHINYMMMETAVFTREFFAARDLVQAGTLGEITYARGTHFQDMTDWPSYWAGLPPMLYSTHAIAPLRTLLS